MRRTIILTALLTLPGLGQAMAQGTCSNTLKQSELTTLFSGTMCVCGAPGAARPNLSWNETHSGGIISELGLAVSGSGGAVGTYAIGGNNGNNAADHGTIAYNSPGGGAFTWVVDSAPSGNTYRFCAPGIAHSPNFLVNIKAGVCTPGC